MGNIFMIRDFIGFAMAQFQVLGPISDKIRPIQVRRLCRLIKQEWGKKTMLAIHEFGTRVSRPWRPGQGKITVDLQSTLLHIHPYMHPPTSKAQLN
jgi:hypothetical protein